MFGRLPSSDVQFTIPQQSELVLFGWDTGLIGGILPRESFKHSFGLDVDPATFAVRHSPQATVPHRR